MKTDCKIVQESPVPQADESTHVLAGASLVCNKKVLTEVVNEESELAKKCGTGVDFQKWTPVQVDAVHCDGVPVAPHKRVDVPVDKGIFG